MRQAATLALCPLRGRYYHSGGRRAFSSFNNSTKGLDSVAEVLSQGLKENIRLFKELQAPNKTLIILTTSTRAHHITFQNFKANVLNVVDADLALSVETQKYPIPDGYQSAAKYIWEMNPPEGFDFMHFYDQISICASIIHLMRLMPR